MSIRVEKTEGGAIVSTGNSSVELYSVDDIRIAIMGLESILDEIVTGRRKGKGK